MLVTLVAAAFLLDIVGPPGSGEFGTIVTVLPNGNLVVTYPYYDSGSLTDVGAVYLYDGTSGALISTLTGSTAGDLVGFFGVIVLANGNYVVRSPWWDNGAAMDAGAATWGSATTGVSGTVSAANSLVGSTVEDMVGSRVTALPNGNYLVSSPGGTPARQQMPGQSPGAAGLAASAAQLAQPTVWWVALSPTCSATMVYTML